ncbi:MAG: Lrp/AsnC family transcriptional regulator [Alphaproteobacteria bacterium]|nr:Lrp/AsnC family transcriptional regulator [Alphaproteobacteria bacterium]
MSAAAPAFDAVDRALVKATQAGLPLMARPYHAIAEVIGIAPEAVMERLRRMQASGVLRRVGVVPNHYALGYVANGMSVWDVDDARIDELGRQVGALAFVTHCYRRPRHLPEWPYNLFAMIHGKSREEVAERVGEIAALLGDAARGRDVLYSTRILKKTGLRLAD